MHSGGLEAAHQHRLVIDGKSLAQYLTALIHQTRRGVLGFAMKSWNNPEEFAATDAACDLFINNHVGNRASRAQGRALLATAAKSFDVPLIGQTAAKVRTNQLPSHLAPAFGVVARGLEISPSRTAGLFVFIVLRGSVSAAVRLGIVGPLEAQQIQAGLARDLEDASELCKGSDPVQTAPIFDLIAATHDRLYSRLFQS